MAFSINLSPSWFISAPISLGGGATPLNSDSYLSTDIKVSVYPTWYDSMSLTWSIPEEWGDCQFHVYFSSSGVEDFTRLTTAPLSDPFFKDPTNQDYSKYRRGTYVVEALLLEKSLKLRSLPFYAEYSRRTHVEKIATEIQRREWLLLSKFAGVKSYLFRTKHFGKRCSRCWNPTTEKVMDDHCPVCLGTSFEGGYYTPITTFIQFEPTGNEKIKDYIGVLEPNQIPAWTIAMPEITPDDIIIRTGDWNVYNVIRVSSTELQTTAVRQMLTLAQLSRGDIENQLSARLESPNSGIQLSNYPTQFSAQRFPKKLVDSVLNNDPSWAQEQRLQQLPKYEI